MSYSNKVFTDKIFLCFCGKMIYFTFLPSDFTGGKVNNSLGATPRHSAIFKT